MKKSDFYFDLPERLIAQHPLEQRDASRLMVLDRKDGSVAHRHFHDMIEYVKPGDCVVFNNSRVIPARLMGHAVGHVTPIEVLLLTDKGDGLWECLTRPGRKTRAGVELTFGDGLLTAAFETASQADVPAETALRCIRILSENAGMNGMIGGQVLDMLSEHRRISEDELRLLQKLKTGCLLRAACELGCIAAGKTDEKTLSDARAYGDRLGLAFQIEDDILDIEGDEKTLGKSIGKDAASEKSTFPALLGLEKCRSLVLELTEQAVGALGAYEGRAFLETLARSLTGRKS